MSESRSALVNLLFGFFPAQVLYATAELGVADELAAGSRSLPDLAATLGADVDGLRRLLRAAAAFGVVDEIEAGRYALGRHGGPMRSGTPDSVRNLIVLFSGPQVHQSWGGLVDSVRDGKARWDEVTGSSPFEYMADNPDYAAMFNQAMAESTRAAVPGILDAGAFKRFDSVVDVGGGDGTLLAAILSAHPTLTGSVFDTEAGAQAAAATLAAAGVGERGHVRHGDFFAAVQPAGAAVYLVKSVLHDWDDEACVKILANCRSAMAPASALLVVEGVLPERAEPTAASSTLVMSDLNMLVCTGGKERTEAEYQALCAAAGLELRSSTPCPGPTTYSVLEAARAS